MSKIYLKKIKEMEYNSCEGCYFLKENCCANEMMYECKNYIFIKTHQTKKNIKKLSFHYFESYIEKELKNKVNEIIEVINGISKL